MASVSDGAVGRVMSRVLPVAGASSRNCRVTVGSARRGSIRSGSAPRDAIAEADGSVGRLDSVRSERASSVGAGSAGPSASGVSMIGAWG